MAIEFKADFAAAVDGTLLSAFAPQVGAAMVAHPTTVGAEPVAANGGMRATEAAKVTRWMSQAAVSSLSQIVSFRWKDTGSLLDILVGLDATLMSCMAIRFFNNAWTLCRYHNETSNDGLDTYSDTVGPGNDTRSGTIRRIDHGTSVQTIVELDGIGEILNFDDTDANRVSALGRVGAQWYELGAPTDANSFRLQALQVGVNSTFAVTSPKRYQTAQRAGATGQITITGTCPDTTTSVEASWNGGSYSVIDSSPVSNTFSGVLVGTKGQGPLIVRDANDHSKTVTVLDVGIGQVIGGFGQSNMVGQGTNPQTYTHPSLKATVFKNDYTFAELSDPWDDATGQIDSVSDDGVGGAHGSYIPRIATQLMAALNEPVMFVPGPKGSTTIDEWQMSGSPVNRGSLLGSFIYRCLQVGGVGLTLWHQGESDAFSAMPTATYKAKLTAIAGVIWDNLGCPVMACLLQNSSGLSDSDEQLLRDAVVQASQDPTSHVLKGPDLSDLPSDDPYHLMTDLKLTTAGDRWAVSILGFLVAGRSRLMNAGFGKRLIRRGFPQASGSYSGRGSDVD